MRVITLYYSIVIGLFINHNVYCQNSDYNIKSYSRHPKLVWSDFTIRSLTDSLPTVAIDTIKIKPKDNACINTRIDLKWDYNTDNYTPNFSYKVYTLFYPKTSWVLESKKNASLLEYLQGCYDITEIHTRKLRKILSEYSVGRNIRKQMFNFHKAIENERSSMQQAYNIQTNFSENNQQQKIWNKKIDSLLVLFEKHK